MNNKASRARKRGIPRPRPSGSEGGNPEGGDSVLGADGAGFEERVVLGANAVGAGKEAVSAVNETKLDGETDALEASDTVVVVENCTDDGSVLKMPSVVESILVSIGVGSVPVRLRNAVREKKGGPSVGCATIFLAR